MPHQCVRCSTFYEDGAEELLKGCPCKGKLFFYIRKDQLDKAKEAVEDNLTPKDKIRMERDVMGILGVGENKPVVLDFESIRVLSPGKYELDLSTMFRKEPLVFHVSDGKYVIDLPEAMKKDKK